MKKKITIQVFYFSLFLPLSSPSPRPKPKYSIKYLCNLLLSISTANLVLFNFLVDEQTRSFNNQNMEYIDEFSTEVAFEQMSESDEVVEAKGRRGVLRIDATDKRPKCQPVGAQIDCR